MAWGYCLMLLQQTAVTNLQHYTGRLSSIHLKGLYSPAAQTCMAGTADVQQCMFVLRALLVIMLGFTQCAAAGEARMANGGCRDLALGCA